MWLSLLLFACVCGLLGEGLEVLRLRAAGIALPAIGLRLTLVAAYAALGAGLFLVAALFGASRRLKVAAALFAVAVFVPWANFELLPAAGSFKSIFGSFAVAALSAAAGWVAASLPRASAAGCALLALAVNAGGGAAAPVADDGARATGKPNVLVILIDTLRADHLGVYGYQRPTSPRIDQLAREGVVFDRAVAQATWTKPSVASLFTGRYVHRHGVIRSRDTLAADLPTLASTLDAAGYRTAGFSANPWITPEFRFSRGFDHYESGRAIGPQLTNLYRTIRRGERFLKKAGVSLPIANAVFRWGGRGNTGNAERDEQLTDAVVSWLGTVGEAQPFFAYVHLIGPHDPYDPPKEFADAFARSSAPAPSLPPPRVQTVFERAEPMEAAARERMIDQYDAAIAHSDSLVGRILDQLERLSLADDTLVIVTSDHGEEFYEHGNWRHGNQLYDEVVRVPLIVVEPGRPAGRRQDPAMLVDVLPTVLGLVDLTDDATLAGVDGRALFPAPDATDQPTFSEHWWFLGGTYVARAAERKGLKLQSTQDETGGRERDELYDLRDDPAERRDLLEQGQAPAEDVAALRALLADFAGDDAPASGGEELGEMDPETIERLRRLGYLGDGK